MGCSDRARARALLGPSVAQLDPFSLIDAAHACAYSSLAEGSTDGATLPELSKHGRAIDAVMSTVSIGDTTGTVGSNLTVAFNILATQLVPAFLLTRTGTGMWQRCEDQRQHLPSTKRRNTCPAIIFSTHPRGLRRAVKMGDGEVCRYLSRGLRKLGNNGQQVVIQEKLVIASRLRYRIGPQCSHAWNYAGPLRAGRQLRATDSSGLCNITLLRKAANLVGHSGSVHSRTPVSSLRGEEKRQQQETASKRMQPGGLRASMINDGNRGGDDYTCHAKHYRRLDYRKHRTNCQHDKLHIVELLLQIYIIQQRPCGRRELSFKKSMAAT